MKKTTLSLAVAALTASLASGAFAGTVKTEGEDIIISTKNGGFSAKTESGDFSFKLSGKLQWDYAAFDGVYTHDKYTRNGNGDADGDEFKDETRGYIRRGEMKVSGTAYKDFHYALKFEYNDDDDGIELDKAYIDYTAIKPVEFRIGKWGREFGLENMTSSSWIMGIERSFLYDVMVGDETNDYGIRAAIYDKQYTLVAGLHNDGHSDSNNGKDDAWGYNLRAAAVPVMTDDMLVHVGLSYFNSNLDSAAESPKNKTNLGVKKSDKLTVFTAEKPDSDTEIVLEGAVQFASLQLQGEYFMREISVKDSVTTKADVELDGYYLQASYMLDGGKRSYKEGSFGKPVGGQWEVFARYSTLTVDAEENASVGVDTTKDVELDSYTLGVNYFATKNVRASLNYVVGDTTNLIEKGTAGNGKKADMDGTGIVGRVQYVF